MAILLMAEEVEDAHLLHQARDKVQRGFPVLHAELELGVVAARDRQLIIGEAEGLEDLFDDVGNVQVLEDAAIGAVSEIPEPRHDVCAVLPQFAASQRSGAELRRPCRGSGVSCRPRR